MYATTCESNLIAYVNSLFTICQQFVHPFQAGLLHLISLSTDCLLLIFHLDCTR
jgi:hypothetical protein